MEASEPPHSILRRPAAKTYLWLRLPPSLDGVYVRTHIKIWKGPADAAEAVVMLLRPILVYCIEEKVGLCCRWAK
jgi:hypothetical protein